MRSVKENLCSDMKSSCSSKVQGKGVNICPKNRTDSNNRTTSEPGTDNQSEQLIPDKVVALDLTLLENPVLTVLSVSLHEESSISTSSI